MLMAVMIALRALIAWVRRPSNASATYATTRNMVAAVWVANICILRPITRMTNPGRSSRLLTISIDTATLLRRVLRAAEAYRVASAMKAALSATMPLNTPELVSPKRRHSADTDAKAAI